MKKALVVLSGGQDSTTCLAWAKKQFDSVFSITYDYKQRNCIEVEQARKISKILNIDNKVIKMDFFSMLTNSALINDSLKINLKSELKEQNLPSAYVPNRNAIFLSVAHSFAQNENIENIILGTTKNDSIEYPDSKKEFIYSLNNLLNISSNSEIKLHTPLIALSKMEVFKFAEKENILDLIIEETHTCYENNRINKYKWGYGCGKCPSCLIRKKAWKEFIKN